MNNQITSAVRSLIRLAAFLLVLVLTPCICHADNTGINTSGGRNRKLTVDPLGTDEGFSTVLYDNVNGLPTSEANAIAETDEGFIWIGSYSGLVRYDGNTFVRLDSTTGVASVVSLFTDSSNRLWIGTNDSGVALMDQNSFTRWGKKEGLRSSYVCAITEDKNGNIYVATTEGIVVIDSSMTLHPFDDPRVEKAYMRNLRVANDGTLYGLTTDGSIFSIKDGKVEYYLSSEDSPVKGVMSILPDPENPGYLYLGNEQSEIYHGSLADNFKTNKKYDISPLLYPESMEYICGQVWICSATGIGVLENGSFYTLRNIPMNSSVGHVKTDYEGNLWFTSTRQGVMKITPNRFSDIFERNKVSKAVVNTTCLYGEDLYVGTDTGLVVIGPDGPLSQVPITKAQTASGNPAEITDLLKFLNGCRIRSIIRDSENRLWISTWRKHGLLRYEEGTLTIFSTEDGLFSDRVRAVYERKDGSVLVACNGGVSIIEGDKVTGGYGEEDGIVNPEILTVIDGQSDDIILGSDGGGIYIVNKDGVRNLGIEDGLSSEIIMRIKRDRINKIYWIVTSNSLAYMTEDYKIKTIRKFPYSNNFDLYQNSVGDMWVFASNGIYVSPVEELLANGEIKPIYYGTANGLPCIPTANSYSELTPDGELYIAGNTGVAKINIEHSYDKISALKVAVPYIDADDTRIYPDKSGRFTIPSGARKITIYSHVYNYSLNNPMVTYKLEGFDRKGTTVSRTDLVPIDYTNLRGGMYYFTMKLTDSMGRGNKTTTIVIIKEKAFYEQVWLYVVIGLLAAGLLAALVRAYVEKRMRILELKHQEEAEKERISNELKMATQIQESMLPSTFPAYPERKEFDVFASMEPAKEVGGDFYDFYMIDDDHLGLVIADVSGKGVPASLFMMITKTIMQSYAMLGISAAEILSSTNESICANNKMEMFVTAWVGILEISTGKLTAANAGHEYPTIYNAAEGSFSLIRDKHGFVIGGMEDMIYRQYEIQLHPGDKLFVYTDGVPEATNSSDELFGTNRMLDALNSSPGDRPRQILSNVREAVSEFVGSAEQFDDLTMLCLEYKGTN